MPKSSRWTARAGPPAVNARVAHSAACGIILRDRRGRSRLHPRMSYQILKAYLWFIAAFHLVVGIAVNVSASLTQAIARGYGATVDWTPQLGAASGRRGRAVPPRRPRGLRVAPLLQSSSVVLVHPPKSPPPKSGVRRDARARRAAVRGFHRRADNRVHGGPDVPRAAHWRASHVALDCVSDPAAGVEHFARDEPLLVSPARLARTPRAACVRLDDPA